MKISSPLTCKKHRLYVHMTSLLAATSVNFIVVASYTSEVLRKCGVLSSSNPPTTNIFFPHGRVHSDRSHFSKKRPFSPTNQVFARTADKMVETLNGEARRFRSLPPATAHRPWKTAQENLLLIKIFLKPV